MLKDKIGAHPKVFSIVIWLVALTLMSAFIIGPVMLYEPMPLWQAMLTTLIILGCVAWVRAIIASLRRLLSLFYPNS